MTGIALSIAASFVFATTTSLARLAYDGGANPATVIGLRFIATGLLLAALARALGRDLRIPREARWPVAGVALGWIAAIVGHVSAVDYIPVGLAGLIFYTFPMMVATFAPLIEGRRPRPSVLLGFLLAFGGLAIVLGPELESIDGRGVALAFGAPVAVSVAVIASGPAVAHIDDVTAAFYLNATGAGLALIVGPFAGGWELPVTSEGLIGFGGTVVVALTATLLYFAAVRRIGPLRMAAIMNLEPLFILALAAGLLGERLSIVQLGGVVLVLAALVHTVRLAQDHSPRAR